MGQVRKVLKASVTAAPALSRLVFFMLLALPVLLMASNAFATDADLIKYAKDVGNSTNKLGQIFNYVSFMIGFTLIALGLSDARRHAESPQQVPIRQPISKVFGGAALVVLPYMASIAKATMQGRSTSMLEFAKANGFTFGSTTAASGESLGALIRNGINNGAVMVSVAGFVAFFIAVFFTMRGIQMLRAHVDNPSQAPLPDALKRLAVGGALFSLPMIANVVSKTFGARGTAMTNTGWGSNRGTAGGLDGMMVNFISDIANPAFAAIELFCYIAGIMLILFGLQRLVRTAQDGPRGPLTFGTITMFVVAGALLSFPQLLTTIDNSLLGGGQAKTQVAFMSIGGIDAAQMQNAKNVFSAVLAFMAVIGFLSVVRGLFILKGFADGNQQATMMSVVTHIVAGSLCINLGSFINAVQTSLGVTDFPVRFN